MIAAKMIPKMKPLTPDRPCKRLVAGMTTQTAAITSAPDVIAMACTRRLGR